MFWNGAIVFGNFSRDQLMFQLCKTRSSVHDNSLCPNLFGTILFINLKNIDTFLYLPILLLMLIDVDVCGPIARVLLYFIHIKLLN